MAGLVLTAVIVAGMAGCAMEVKRISPDEVVDLSGNWNDTDSQLVAEEMVKEALSRPWVAQHMKKHAGDPPKVIVGTIKNKTDEHIAIDTFQKDIERELTNSGMVEFVAGKGERDEIRYEREDQQTYASESTRKQMYAETGADYMMHGTISKITDARGDKQTFYYQVDMELTDLQRNIKVWFGNKKIKKYIKKPGARF
ncbi:penicillin-binding protein activator LpoB [candidate division FCPU426 bacterium]|nr:penicillin-binding protein activator LpoB [candidate division FCPU426 bacterium]